MVNPWFVRFLLGLSCRPQDARAVRRDLPELFTWRSQRDLDRMERRLDTVWPEQGREFSLERLRGWVWIAEHEMADPDEGGEEISLPPVEGHCPLASCPLRRPEGSNGRAGSGGTPRASVCEDGVLDASVAQLMVVGGSSQIAPHGSRPRFLDLVRRVHAGQRPSRVYITDPYVLTQEDESGNPSSHWSFARDYFEALRVQSDFECLMWNSKYDSADESLRQAWTAMIVGQYPDAQVRWPTSGAARFHDRFYLASNPSRTDFRGVFGPSLNGLDGPRVFIAGDLERTAIDVFRRMLDGDQGLRRMRPGVR